MPSPPATLAPRAASCFATEAVRQGRPEPPPPPFQPHPSPRLRQIKGGGLQSHQASRVQELLMGGEGRWLTERTSGGSRTRLGMDADASKPLLQAREPGECSAHPCLSLNSRIVLASIRVMPFASMIGHSPLSTPKVSHSASPVTSTRNILSEISPVERVRHTRTTCGT